MIINANTKDMAKLKKLMLKYNKTDIQTKIDENVEVPIIMVHIDGELKEWTRTMENVSTFIKHGYVRIIKNCPLRTGKCIGEKCQWYIINNNTGDCTSVWNIFKN